MTIDANTSIMTPRKYNSPFFFLTILNISWARLYIFSYFSVFNLDGNKSELLTAVSGYFDGAFNKLLGIRIALAQFFAFV